MGYCLSPYAVDFAAVTAAVGSKDEQLLADLLEEAGDELGEIDALTQEFDEDEEEEDDDEDDLAVDEEEEDGPGEDEAEDEADEGDVEAGDKDDDAPADAPGEDAGEDEDAGGDEAGEDEEGEDNDVVADDDDTDAGAGPTMAGEALEHLVAGGPYDEAAGTQYGFGLEFICRHFGEHLDNEMWSAMRLEWATQVDKALR